MNGRDHLVGDDHPFPEFHSLRSLLFAVGQLLFLHETVFHP